MYPEDKYPHQKITERIIGAAMEVHGELGHGYTEPVYQESFEIEFDIQKIPFVSQPEVNISYKGRKLRKTFRPDFIANGEVVVEIKAATGLNREDEAQVLNYLKATGFRVALLLNFGTARIQIKRMIL